jgi:hypothetical protein
MDNNETRRKVLTRLGCGVPALTGVLGLQSTGAEADVSTSGINTGAWDDFTTYAKEKELDTSSDGLSTSAIVGPDDLYIPKPSALPLDVCASWPGNEICVSTASQVRKTDYNCTNRTVNSLSISVERKEIGEFGDVSIQYSIGFWIGVDQLGCTHVGATVFDSDLCVIEDCPFDPSSFSTIYSARQEILPIAKDILDWIRENVSDGNPPRGSPAYVALAVIIAAIIIGAGSVSLA